MYLILRDTVSPRKLVNLRYLQMHLILYIIHPISEGHLESQKVSQIALSSNVPYTIHPITEEQFKSQKVSQIVLS